MIFLFFKYCCIRNLIFCLFLDIVVVEIFNFFLFLGIVLVKMCEVIINDKCILMFIICFM